MNVSTIGAEWQIGQWERNHRVYKTTNFERLTCSREDESELVAPHMITNPKYRGGGGGAQCVSFGRSLPWVLYVNFV